MNPLARINRWRQGNTRGLTGHRHATTRAGGRPDLIDLIDFDGTRRRHRWGIDPIDEARAAASASLRGES